MKWGTSPKDNCFFIDNLNKIEDRSYKGKNAVMLAAEANEPARASIS